MKRSDRTYPGDNGYSEEFERVFGKRNVFNRIVCDCVCEEYPKGNPICADCDDGICKDYCDCSGKEYLNE